MNDIATAHQSEAGVQAICPTTGQAYIPTLVRYSTHNGRQIVTCACRHCDAMRRTRTDRAFNPSEPQWHMYEVTR